MPLKTAVPRVRRISAPAPAARSARSYSRYTFLRTSSGRIGSRQEDRNDAGQEDPISNAGPANRGHRCTQLLESIEIQDICAQKRAHTAGNVSQGS